MTDHLDTKCTCTHSKRHHGGMASLGGCTSCSCGRFVDVPVLPEGVTEVMHLFTDAQKQVTEAKANLIEAERHANTSAVIVANRFLDLYNALPVDVRNKIRHAINTTKDGKSYDDPKRAEP